MIFIKLFFFVFILSINSQQIYECDFDYGQICLLGLQSASYILLNETSEQPRQPASDVTAIDTSNDMGECYFPFQLNSFEMFFCEKSDPNLPSTCPTLNGTGPRINCSEGEYGYELFEMGEIGYRSYKVDLTSQLSSGQHCIRFYYYLSDQYSNGTIQVIIQDTILNQNQTILIAYLRLQNRWHEIRENFYLDNPNPTIYFLFQREYSSDFLPYYMAIDDITIIDLECDPIPTTTIITTTQTLISTTTATTTRIISTISSSTQSSQSTFISTSTNPMRTSSTSTSSTTINQGTTSIEIISSTTNYPQSSTISTSTQQGSSSIKSKLNKLFFFI
ncbi:unnamed protein product [Rotaria sordida]|uniref:MAM domain-containing protein n=1 Tax=Rotaria sordida TaxID=392033 RepID=A0A814U1Z6_9BILA|nr:unnamed protein product [Rotaria sordida]